MADFICHFLFLRDIGTDFLGAEYGNIRTIEKRVQKSRAWLTCRKDYPQNSDAQKMIGQIDKYREKLFADPITVQTPSGPILIQSKRTNNILSNSSFEASNVPTAAEPKTPPQAA